MVTFGPISIQEANDALAKWNHKMGPCLRGNRPGRAHGLKDFEGDLVAVTITSCLIRENPKLQLTRKNAIELSRLCAARPQLCRVVLRLWREFILPTYPHRFAVSYQDADIHTGNTYRFDGWKRMTLSRSGTDTRSGRKGRNKWIWLWDQLKEDHILLPPSSCQNSHS